MNHVTLSGFLGKDPELKVVSDKFKVANFSIPYSESYKNKDGEKVTTTHWFNCKAVMQTAEFVVKYFKKGSGIEVEGKLKTDTWEKDGVKHTAVYIQVENVSFPPVKKESNNAPEITDNLPY
jgi:single-strand DNA-binding protein